jgi:phosphoribosylamine--glycine ligase
LTANKSPRVLLYGKDARTDAIAEAILRSGESPELAICAPIRIPGLVNKADRFLVASMTDLEAMMIVAKEIEPDLAIIGPEDPLAIGLVDALEAAGVPCFGPPRDLARIETSKSWARELVDRHGIPGNPAHRSFTSENGLAAFVDEVGDVVVKPDGLTGGKGVRVMGEQLADSGQALAYALSSLQADGTVVIEERLVGEEFSLMTITDGASVVHCPPAQDHKRAYDGDTGPNTGGMGSYSCADHSLPFLDASDLRAAQHINEAVIAALAADSGRPYRGVLYGGFMAVRDGVRLVEYNARFGDPEAMNVLPLLDTDFLAVARAVVSGTLGSLTVGFERRATVCKYVVPAAYPEPMSDDPVIEIDESAGRSPSLRHYWAAADLCQDGSVRLTGSRGLAFVGIADSLDEAEVLAEKGASSVRGAVRHRRDIGTTEVIDKRVSHMSAVRGIP